jgi:hypothetical protein
VNGGKDYGVARIDAKHTFRDIPSPSFSEGASSIFKDSMFRQGQARSFARAMLILPAVLAAACSDLPSAMSAGDAGPLFSTICQTADHVNFTYGKDALLNTTGTSSLYTGELRWVDIDVRDAGGCRLPASRISSVAVDSTTLLGLKVESSVNPIYRLQALRYRSSGAQLKVVADGKTFTSSIALFNPTVRFFNGAGAEITGTLPVEVGIFSNVSAKAFAGSTLSAPVIPTVGWSGTRTWTTGNAAASVAVGGTTADAAQASIKGVTVGSSSMTVQMLGVTKTVAVDVRAKAAVATVTVTGPTSLTQGQTGSYTAVPKDANGNVLSGRTVTWSVDNTAVATTTQAGVVSAVGAGSTSVRATIDGKAGTAPLQVTGTPGVNLTLAYPGGVPTLNWTTTFSGVHDVFIVYEEEVIDVEFGNQWNQHYEWVGSTSGTTFQDTGHSYTANSVCNEGINPPYSYRNVTTNYIVIPAVAPTVPSQMLRADISPGAAPCYLP